MLVLETLEWIVCQRCQPLTVAATILALNRTVRLLHGFAPVKKVGGGVDCNTNSGWDLSVWYLELPFSCDWLLFIKVRCWHLWCVDSF